MIAVVMVAIALIAWILPVDDVHRLLQAEVEHRTIWDADLGALSFDTRNGADNVTDKPSAPIILAAIHIKLRTRCIHRVTATVHGDRFEVERHAIVAHLEGARWAVTVGATVVRVELRSGLSFL